MDKRIRRALKASIAHWEEAAQAEHHSELRIGAEFCPLCALCEGNCSGCPVNDAGFGGCEGSPYGEAYDALSEWRYNANPHAKEGSHRRWREAAIAEINFLKGLL